MLCIDTKDGEHAGKRAKGERLGAQRPAVNKQTSKQRVEAHLEGIMLSYVLVRLPGLVGCTRVHVELLTEVLVLHERRVLDILGLAHLGGLRSRQSQAAAAQHADDAADEREISD